MKQHIIRTLYSGRVRGSDRKALLTLASSHVTMPSPLPPTQSSYLRFLTGVQNTSALAFSTFLAVHLASPVLASFGGGEVATKVMVSRLHSLVNAHVM
jgi:hypothetical protein